MPATYDSIATQSIANTTTNTVTFSSIPNTFSDLRIVGHFAGRSAFELQMRFNNDSSSLYARRYMRGTDTTPDTNTTVDASQITMTVFNLVDSQSTAGARGMITIDIMNYVGSNNKTSNSHYYAAFNSSTSTYQYCHGLWRSTSVIDRIDISTVGGNFENGSVFALYGIKRA